MAAYYTLYNIQYRYCTYFQIEAMYMFIPTDIYIYYFLFTTHNFHWHIHTGMYTHMYAYVQCTLYNVNVNRNLHYKYKYYGITRKPLFTVQHCCKLY